MANPPNPQGRATSKQVLKKGSISSGTPQPEWRVTDDGKGMLTGTLKLFIDAKTGASHNASEMSVIPKRGDKHPYDERLYCNDVQTTFGSNDIAYCEANYVGLLQDPSGIEWELNTPTEEDDILTHPDLVSVKANWGTVTADGYNNNGQIPWDTKNVIIKPDGRGDFGGFKNNEHNRSPEIDLAGVEKWKVPRATMRVTWNTASQANWIWAVKYLGYQTKSVPLAPDWTNVSDQNRSWLLSSTSVTQYGGTIYRIQAEYILSGQTKPWNKLIYKEFQADTGK